MATFVDKEYPVRSANAGFMPTLVHAVFLDAPLRELPCKNALFRSRAFFARDGDRQRQGMQTALRLRAGVDDSQSVELRDRGGMAMTVLTLQQF